MKNLVALHEPEMLFEYVGRIWRSPIFQASHQDPNGYIHRLIRQFSEQPEPRNTIEQMISQYTVSSLKWAQIWKNSWREVEEHVCQFIAFKYKEKALNMHLSWLTEKQAQSKSGVIFEQEAQAYSEVHQTMFTSAYQPIN